MCPGHHDESSAGRQVEHTTHGGEYRAGAGKPRAGQGREDSPRVYPHGVLYRDLCFTAHSSVRMMMRTRRC